ncbi:Tfp pilus assembly protein PilX [Paenibacillus sacheonensis]|nr:Tfp pilus assembly protein PilX [Paenibacillus sacheonensis]
MTLQRDLRGMFMLLVLALFVLLVILLVVAML